MSDEPQYYLTNPSYEWHHLTAECDLIVKEIEDANPAGVLCFSGTEMDLGGIWGNLWDRLNPWCTKTGKKVYVFSSNMPVDYAEEFYRKGFLEWYRCETYDIHNLHNSIRYCLEGRGPATAPVKLYTCYNNRPCDYRTYLIDQLAETGYMLRHGIVTYKKYMEYMINDGLRPDEMYYPFKHYRGTPILIDEDDFDLHQRGYACDNLPRSYLHGAIDIVTESRIDKGEFYLSEKTNKPITARKPFLVLSSPGYHHWLQEYKGIEMYDELFDYSFDFEPDYRVRAQGIVENLQRLWKKYNTPEQFRNLLLLTRPKADRNQLAYWKHVLSGVSTYNNIPFEWFKEKPYPDVYDHITTHYREGEFYTVHHFLNTVSRWYQEHQTYRFNDVEYSLEDILNFPKHASR